MAKLLKEISVITGKYTNAQGQEKNRYTRIGSIIDTKNGEMLKIDVTPVMEGGWSTSMTQSQKMMVFQKMTI